MEEKTNSLVSRVGIGTDTPTAKLDVVGRISVDSLNATNDIVAGTGVGARSQILDTTVLECGASCCT